MKYWLRVNAEAIGHISAEQVRKISGVSENTFVRPEGATSDWRRLRDVPALSQVLRDSVAPSPLPRSAPPPPTAHATSSKSIGTVAVAVCHTEAFDFDCIPLVDMAVASSVAPAMTKFTTLALATLIVGTAIGVKYLRIRDSEWKAETEAKLRAESAQCQ